MNSTHLKAGFAIALLLLAALAGLYLSGFLTLLFLKLNSGGMKWWVYLDYVRTIDVPQVRPYAGRIKAAGAIGFGTPLLAYAALLVLIVKPRQKSLHGDARFAGTGDLSRHDMFKETPKSIVVGRFGGKLVRLPGQQHVILAAPSRSGKGIGVVIPNLLTYSDSMVVLDIKGENYEITSGWRASQGQEIYRFDPFSETHPSLESAAQHLARSQVPDLRRPGHRREALPRRRRPGQVLDLAIQECLHCLRALPVRQLRGHGEDGFPQGFHDVADAGPDLHAVLWRWFRPEAIHPHQAGKPRIPRQPHENRVCGT